MDVNHHNTKLLEISSRMTVAAGIDGEYEVMVIALTDRDGRRSAISVFSDGGPLAFEYKSPRPLEEDDTEVS